MKDSELVYKDKHQKGGQRAKKTASHQFKGARTVRPDGAHTTVVENSTLSRRTSRFFLLASHVRK
eukprot:1386732-Amorphochlora_amoeboformis.AAC.1